MKFTKSSPIPWLIIVSMLMYSALAQNESVAIINNNSTSEISEIPLSCPPPLIAKDPNSPENEFQSCLKGCCLSCPIANNFYEKGKIENTFKIFSVLGMISFFLMAILCYFFIALPSQRQNPLVKVLLVPLILSVMCFEGAEFFTFFQKQSQCVDSITPANARNNRYCAVQAFFTLSGAFAIGCYSSLLMIHLHLVSVWRVEFIANKISLFHVLIFGISLSAFIVPYATNGIQSTNICFISLDSAPEYFYFMSFIYIAFAAHLTTFIYMAHITIKSNKHYSTISTMSRRNTIIEAQRKLNHLNTIFKMQWRALLGALLMLIIYVLNWNFYVIELQLFNSSFSSFVTSDWVSKWIICLQNGDQSFCAKEIKDDIPSYKYIVALLFFNRTAGILIFIIFAAKRSVILEAYDFIRGVRNPRMSRMSFSETEARFSGVRSRRTTTTTIEGGLNNVNVINNNILKSDGDTGSIITESATLATSERTSDSKADQNRVSISFSQSLPSRSNSLNVTTSTTPTSLRNPPSPTLHRQSILKKTDT